jgi:hypothetical protein
MFLTVVSAEPVASYYTPQPCCKTENMGIWLLSLVRPKELQEACRLGAGVRESRVFGSHTVSLGVSKYTDEVVNHPDGGAHYVCGEVLHVIPIELFKGKFEMGR